MENVAQAPRSLNPVLDSSEYDLRRRINEIDAKFRRGTAVDTLEMSRTLSTHDFADYLSMCRMLRAKTRRTPPAK